MSTIVNEIVLEDGQENPASLFVDENGKIKFKDRDSVSYFMSTLAAQGGVAKLIDAAHGQPSDALPSEVVVYIDLDDMQLYKRTESGWGVGLELRGERGPKGNAVLQGPTNPNVVQVTDSSVGDIYIETGVDSTTPRRIWRKTNEVVGALHWEHAGLPFGRDGNDGVNGREGSKVYTGTDDPNSSQPAGASTGDLYFETDSHLIYKKLDNDSWTTIGPSYKGANGASVQGPRGYGVYLGNLNPNNNNAIIETPDLSEAKIGDVYIELDSHRIWKKTHDKNLETLAPGVEEWTAKGAPFKGTDGRNLFQGVGDPNDFTETSEGLPAGILSAKIGDLYIDTSNYQNWKVTALNAQQKPVWITLGVSYRSKGLIQGKIDPNIFEDLQESEITNTIEYPDKLSDYLEVKGAKINDLYIDVDSHKIYYKNSQNMWVQKGETYASKAVVLEASSYFIAFDPIGKNPSPSISTITATQIKHEGTIEYEFSKLVGSNRTILQRGSSNTYQIDFSEDDRFGAGDYFETPYTLEVRTYEVSTPSKANVVIAKDSLSILAGKEGSSTPQLVLSNPYVAFNQDEEGNIDESQYSSSIVGNSIKFIIGTVSLDAINRDFVAGDKNVFRIKVNEISGISLYSHPTLTTNSYKLLKDNFINNGDGQQFDTYAKYFDSFGDRKQAFIEYKAYAKDSAGRDIEVVARQIFSTSKDGATGQAAKLVNLTSNKLTFNKNSSNIFEPLDQTVKLSVDIQGFVDSSITESNWHVRVLRTNGDFEVNPTLYLKNFSSDKKTCTLGMNSQGINDFQTLLNTLIKLDGTTVSNPAGSYAYGAEISVIKDGIKSAITLSTVKNGAEAKIFVVALNTGTNSTDTTLKAYPDGKNQIGDGTTLYFNDVKLSRGNIVSLNQTNAKTSFRILSTGKYKVNFFGSFYSRNSTDSDKNVTVYGCLTKTNGGYSKFYPVREISSTINVPKRIATTSDVDYFYGDDDKKYFVDNSSNTTKAYDTEGIIATPPTKTELDNLFNSRDSVFDSATWDQYEVLMAIASAPSTSNTSVNAGAVGSTSYVTGKNSGNFVLSLSLYLKENDILRFKARVNETVLNVNTYLVAASDSEETDTVVSIEKIG